MRDALMMRGQSCTTVTSDPCQLHEASHISWCSDGTETSLSCGLVGVGGSTLTLLRLSDALRQMH